MSRESYSPKYLREGVGNYCNVNAKAIQNFVKYSTTLQTLNWFENEFERIGTKFSDLELLFFF